MIWGKFDSALSWLDRGAAVVAAAVLLGVTVLLLLDVVGRGFGHPVTGAQDLAEMAMIAILFGALPLLERQAGQIRVDLLQGVMPDWLSRASQRATSLLAAVVWFTLAWTLIESAELSRMLSLSSNILGLPKAPFQYLLAMFVTLAGLGSVMRLVAAKGHAHV